MSVCDISYFGIGMFILVITFEVLEIGISILLILLELECCGIMEVLVIFGFEHVCLVPCWFWKLTCGVDFDLVDKM